MAIFQILLCEDNQYTYVDEGRETLLTGQTWAFTGSTGQIICGTVIEESLGVANFTASTEYDGCGDCIGATLQYFSANTDYNVCVTCDGKPIEVEVEHPVWTNLYGQPVVQLNAVELGGRNGLNS